MSQQPLIAGQTLRNRYKIVKLLGSGGFGDTYLAVDLDLPGQPQCVVKHLKPKNPNPAVLPIAKSLFDREAQILYQLGNDHDQIPRLFAHFEENKEFYLVQEFIEGHDLSKEITLGLPKSENVVFKLLKDILEVLTVVHQHNVIHRDIKPQNLMRRRKDGKIVLIDFGAIKEIEALGVNAQGQTSLTVAVGSPGYMPSEQANGKPKLCSDVYAVGITGIQALTGFMPHQLKEDPNTGKVIWRNFAQVSDSLADVLDTMVHPYFSQRYQSAAAALQALNSIVVQPQPRSQPQPAPSVTQRQPQPVSAPSPVLSSAVSSRHTQLSSGKVLGGLGIGTVAIITAYKFLTSTPSPIANPPESTSSESQSTASSTGKLDFGGNVSLTGAGASFPAPLYQTWFQALKQKYPNLQVNYQSVGRGAGVQQFTAGTVDFGASDVAMTDLEIQKVQRGVILLPMTAGAIVLSYNLPSVQQPIKLPRDVYTNIFLGKIKSWNDPKITVANLGVNLPNQPIAVVHRSDGSGTTAVFTQHLSAISPEWNSGPKSGKTVNWPVGVGAKGNEGVTAQITQTQGAIGYVEYGYAKQNNLKFAALQNKAGSFIDANDGSAAKTLESVTLPDNLRAFITDPEGKDSYPIITYTWLLVYKQYPDKAKAKAVEAMIEYGLTDGQKASTQLGYVPLPQNVIREVASSAQQISPDYKINVGSSGTK